MSRKPLMLIIDDNELLRFGYSIAFDRAGFQVVLADSGITGLEMARAHIPDIVLLDLNMPGLDGWQTVRALALDPRTAGLGVVAFTGELDVSIVRLRSAGFRGYIEKGRALQATIDLVRLFLSDENRGKDWVDLSGSPPANWAMKDAG